MSASTGTPFGRREQSSPRNVRVIILPSLPPAITLLGATGTSFSIGFPVVPHASYIVEETMNLAPPATWLTVTQLFALSTNQGQITDNSTTNAQRRYRVRTQ
jgi:hypothetical protein